MGWPARSWCRLFLVLCLVSPTAALSAGPVGVVVSILPEKYFVERVGGKYVEVTVLVGPGRDPHTYEPTPRQVTLLARAAAYFRIGLPFEEAWLPRIERANPNLQVVDLSAGLPSLTPRAGQPHEEPAGRSSGDVNTASPVPPRQQGRGDAHGHSDKDPHTWTSPLLVKAMAQRIRKTLVELDPAHAAEYAANEAAFARDLDALDRNYP